MVFFCNINHFNDSAPYWDLDWTIKSYLILSVICLVNKLISIIDSPPWPKTEMVAP